MKWLWTILLPAFLSTGGCAKNVEIIAHRGASYLAPENTLASVTKAWRLDADAVEIDVYLSNDNRIMVIHDKTTKRTTAVEMDVEQSSSAQLRQLDAGAFKAAEYRGEKIPFVEEVLDTIPPKKKLYIEIKCGPEIVPYIERAIEQSGKKRRIVIISFNFDALTEAKRTMPDIPAYWLVSTRRDKETKEYLPHDPAWITQVAQGGIDGLDVHNAGLTESFAHDVLSAHLGLYVWTVDDPEEALRLKKLGVRGITTNRPAWLKDQMRSH